MSTLPKTFITPEQYLEIERKAEFRSEYYNGEMFAMSGASWPHSLIVAHLTRELSQQLRQRPCSVVSQDLRVRVKATGLYTYPDVVVVCGEPQFSDDKPDTLLNPSVIIEVLSPTTEAYDRGRKFGHYRAIESLREYVLVSSDIVSAELFVRREDGQWTLTAADKMEDAIEIPSVQCRLALADIYEKVKLGL